jgi:hypothetical protein
VSEQLELIPQPPKLSTCRSCRRSIIWCRTERGKKMPLDADPVEDQTQASLFVLRETEKREGPLAIAAWGLVGLESHYRSHFATCPNADSHRGGSVDLTLTCPVCGRRADMCFEHGDDWKKRTEQPPQDPGWRHAGSKYRTAKR